MNKALKGALQVVFLIGVIWSCAALIGYAPGARIQGPGFGVRIGKGKRRGRQERRAAWRRKHRFPIGASPGMVGEFCANSTGSMRAVGPMPIR